MSDALEVTLIGMRCVANGEVHLSFAVQKDDAHKTQLLIGKVGHPFGMALARINYQATGELPPVSSADQTQTGNNGVLDSLDTPTEPDNALGGHSTVYERGTSSRTTPGAELKQPPGNLSKRAAIWCQKPDVQLFMHKEYCIPRNFESVKGKIKELLEIQSLKEIVEGSNAATDYLALELKFKMWLNDPKYVSA